MLIARRNIPADSAFADDPATLPERPYAVDPVPRFRGRDRFQPAANQGWA